MNTNEEQKSFLKIAIELFGKVTNILSVIIAFSTFAYIIGWFQAKAYFNAFGASWILTNIDALELLKFSWLPLIALLFFFWLGIDDLAATQNQKPNKRQQKAFWIVDYGRWIVGGLMILSFSLDNYEYEKASDIITVITIGAFLLLASSAFEILIIFLRENKFTWDRVDASLIFIIVAVGFYFLPTKIGSIQGRMDIDNERSTLPIVKLTDDNNNKYRMLYYKNDQYFIYPIMKPDSNNIKIKVVHSSLIEYITKKDN